MVARSFFTSLMFAVVVCAGAPSWSAEAPDFFVAPATTQMHRTTITSGADVYAAVNCNALVVDGKVDSSGFASDAFVKELASVRGDRTSLKLVFRYQMPPSPDRANRQEIKAMLTELAHQAGYTKVVPSEVMTSVRWDNRMSAALSDDEPSGADENQVENEYVRLFPIRTRLSKFIHGDTSCIVEVLDPIDGRTEGISPELRTAIVSAVQTSEMRPSGTLMFRLMSTEAGREKVDTLFDARLPPPVAAADDPFRQEIFAKQAAGYKPSPALQLAQELGFEKITYSHSPGGGAPEKLVGKRVPNFTLPNLNGESLELHSFIDGGPALITFWGLACGPCRIEAPHLSTMHDRYAEQGLSIVAVNGYDDRRDAVAEYVANAKLNHPIVLEGGKIADELFHVGAYPTTYWINADGELVDYEVGFTSPERLERRVRKLLGLE